ncbi:YfmQ family protein [Lysinibacillus sp. NPDC093190]|uniref:YfmQ family protein n=1 Tax=Lysinibacillus sp. NPDC093190 TaxID=3390575 RepID=UPI003D007B12
MTSGLIITLVIGSIIKLLMSPPSIAVAWGVSKFELHKKLDAKDVTVTFNGTNLEEEEKNRFTDYFNKASFLKKYYIFPGNEKLFLQPETNVTPFVINVKRGKKEDVNFFVFSYDNHVDVVKKCKEKVVSYSISSEYLQNFSILTTNTNH